MGIELRAGMLGLALALTASCGLFKEAPEGRDRGARVGGKGGKAGREEAPEAAAAVEADAWDEGRDPPGRRKRLREARSGKGEEGDPDVEALEALGYVAEGNEAGKGPTGVIGYVPEKAFAGTNLIVSAHAYELDLLDMEGKVVHTWRPPRAEIPADAKVNGFRRAWLLPNGDVLAVVEGRALLKLDVNGKVLWKSELNQHHDVAIGADGTLHTLTREVRTIPAFRDTPVVEDRITILSASGELQKELSVLKALARSPFTAVLEAARAAPIDALHTNSIELLDGTAVARHPAFAAGNYLLSARTISTIFVVDPRTETVVWAKEAPWRNQHDPKILPDGTMMVFDNHNPGPSAVTIHDPADGRELWRWDGGKGAGFFTKCCGTAERLPNGNTLVVSTDDGRVIEVDAEGERVWAWQSPHRAGDSRKVARLFDVVRTPPVDQLPWLGAR